MAGEREETSGVEEQKGSGGIEQSDWAGVDQTNPYDFGQDEGDDYLFGVDEVELQDNEDDADDDDSTGIGNVEANNVANRTYLNPPKVKNSDTPVGNDTSAVKVTPIGSAGFTDLYPQSLTDEEKKEINDRYDPQVKTYRDIMDALEPLETKEQREKRLRREKSNRIIGAVSDGLSALSNLWFTSQYAPNMYEHKNGLSEAEKARQEKAKADRQANQEAHLKYALGLMNAEAARDRALQDALTAKQKGYTGRLEALIKQKNQGNKDAVAQAQIGRLEAQTETEKWRGQEAQAKGEAAPEYYAARNENEKKKSKVYDSQVHRNNSQANAANASAEKTRKDSDGKSLDLTVFDDGKLFVIPNENNKMYEKTVYDWARRYGVTIEAEDSRTKKKTPRKVADIASEVEYKARIRAREHNKNTSKGAGYGTSGSSNNESSKGAGYGS